MIEEYDGKGCPDTIKLARLELCVGIDPQPSEPLQTPNNC